MSDHNVLSEIKFAGHFRVRQDTFASSTGEIKTRDIVEYPEAVAMVAVDNGGNFILEKQYRHAAGRELLEIPAGGIDSGETPEQAVCRETQEETGYLPKTVEHLTSFYSAPGYSTEILHVYLVNNLVESRLTAEDSDEITLVRMSRAEVVKSIRNGAIRDGKSIAGLLYYFNVIGSA
ncbi:ADP-ribose diphosphatase [Dehalogenimonas formicexedens]|uniref:ADP-ribose diphosphatase n=1 Tax=Dehalogenimonas formicexedens TaxID=1839801 RepID=A0A1P8F805_9CHLR|nr:NUDIX hydrolase [Dehalogenimonas formicexedens]APV44575.1 ADP-ribose diphosphatase [Dehalogenimonas formicexedens]